MQHLFLSIVTGMVETTSIQLTSMKLEQVFLDILEDMAIDLRGLLVTLKTHKFPALFHFIATGMELITSTQQILMRLALLFPE